MTDSHPTLVLGLGNPILTDDRVGIVAAQALCERLPAGAAVFQEICVGGFELLHVLEGWDRVLLVDAYKDPLRPDRLAPGEVAELSLEELQTRCGALSPHTAGLPHCLELGRRCGMAMPHAVRVFVIGVRDPYTFGERCTPEVEARLPAAVETILGALGGPGGWLLGC